MLPVASLGQLSESSPIHVQKVCEDRKRAERKEFNLTTANGILSATIDRRELVYHDY